MQIFVARIDLRDDSAAGGVILGCLTLHHSTYSRTHRPRTPGGYAAMATVPGYTSGVICDRRILGARRGHPVHTAHQ